jgi:hypothetical protein
MQKFPEVLAIDPASGQQVAGRAPISMGSGRYAPAYALSADNRRLAVISGEGASCEPYAGGTSCRSRAEVIHIIDLQAWREVSGTLPATGWAGPAAFSPDGQRVALAINKAAGSTLVTIDTGSGETLAQRQVEFLPSLLGFTSSASGGAGELVAYGQAPGPKPGIDPPDPPQVMVVDAKTLATRWVSGLEGVASGTWCVENCDA